MLPAGAGPVPARLRGRAPEVESDPSLRKACLNDAFSTLLFLIFLFLFLSFYFSLIPSFHPSILPSILSSLPSLPSQHRIFPLKLRGSLHLEQRGARGLIPRSRRAGPVYLRHRAVSGPASVSRASPQAGLPAPVCASGAPEGSAGPLAACLSAPVKAEQALVCSPQRLISRISCGFIMCPYNGKRCLQSLTAVCQ